MDQSSNAVALLARVRRHDYSALDTLEQMAQANPKKVTAAVQQFLLVPRIADDMSFCVVLVHLLNQALGRTEAERWIRQMWASGDEVVRDNLAPAAFDPQAMATDLVLDLFNYPSSTIQNRHHLLAGLASSMKQRHCERQVRALMSKVGVYTDPARQAVLDQFLADLERSLAECS